MERLPAGSRLGRTSKFRACQPLVGRIKTRHIVEFLNFYFYF